MDLKALRYSVAVADRLNFTRAARDMNVSQPALSQQLRLLEEELGVRLFERTSHAVKMTQAGELVIGHARHVLAGSVALRDAVEEYRGLRLGRLQIGVTQTFNALYLGPMLSSFLAEHDRLEVTVLELSNRAILADLADGTIDLGVALGPAGGMLTAEALYSDRLMLICAEHHRFAKADEVPVSALATETLALLTTDFATRQELDLFFQANGVALSRLVQFNTFAAILNLVASGNCLSVIPAQENGVAPFAGFRLLPLAPMPPSQNVQLVLPSVQARTPAAKALATKLRARFRSASG